MTPSGLLGFIAFVLVLFALYRSGQAHNKVRELESRLARVEKSMAGNGAKPQAAL
jgi:hypothetical protein